MESLLQEGEQVSVAAGRSTYEAGLNKLAFTVAVITDRGQERVDELLDPEGGIRRTLEDSEHRPLVIAASGYPPFQQDRLGVQWTAELLS